MMSDTITKKQAVLFLRFLYPIWMIVGILTLLYIPSQLIIQGDIATTAKNLIENESLFRLSILGSLLVQLIHIVVVILICYLFKGVNKLQERLFLIFGLIGVPIAMFNTINWIAALLSVNDPATMMFFLNLYPEGESIASIFWGLWLLPLGVLVLKSKYFPKFIAYALFIGGLGYFFGSLLHFVFPNVGWISVVFIDLMTIGEMVFIFWLIIKGATLSENN